MNLVQVPYEEDDNCSDPQGGVLENIPQVWLLNLLCKNEININGWGSKSFLISGINMENWMFKSFLLSASILEPIPLNIWFYLDIDLQRIGDWFVVHLCHFMNYFVSFIFSAHHIQPSWRFRNYTRYGNKQEFIQPKTVVMWERSLSVIKRTKSVGSDHWNEWVKWIVRVEFPWKNSRVLEP